MNLFAGLVLIIAVAWAGLYRLSISIDELLEDAVIRQASTMTRANVSIGSVKTALAHGKGTIATLEVANPVGYRMAHAFKAESIEVDIDLASLATDIVVIRLITINRPDVNFEHGAATSNFDAILDNINTHLDAKRRKYDDDGKKLIAQELTICNATAQAGARFMGGKTLSIPLPDITLRNIGKEQGGVNPAELGQIVASVLNTKLSSAASVNRLARAIDETVPAATRSVEAPHGFISRRHRL